ncbi:MAG: radical SAM protein [Candidatus Aenigmatarchaeota archaeon]
MKLLQWDVTGRCNLNCKHCRRGNENKNSELSFGQGVKLLKEAKKLGIEIFNFSGGEPFLRDDIFHFIDMASNFFKEVVVTTNGTLITEKLARRLSGYKNLRLSISLDGYGKDHDRFRGTKGVFREVVDGLKFLKKNNIRFSVKFTFQHLLLNRLN